MGQKKIIVARNLRIMRSCMKAFITCTFLTAFLFMTAKKANASVFNQLETAQECEVDYTYSGPGMAQFRPRSNASSQGTVWVNETEGEISWEITIPAAGEYSLVVRYSNDDTGILDHVSVRINGNLAGGFESEDTGGGGFGWNIFVESPIIPLGQLPAGPVTLSLRLDDQDGFGIEYDKLTLTGVNIQAPPTPLLVLPVNGETDFTTDPFMIWAPSSGVNTYSLQVDDNPNFSSPEVAVDGLFSTDYQVAGLQQGTVYYWRVRASNVCLDSPWSTPWVFSTECLVHASITPNGMITICEGEGVQLNASGGQNFCGAPG